MNKSLIYRRFGKTNIMLSALGLGTNRFKTGSQTDIVNSIELVQEALENGVNYIDIAQNYSNGKGEDIVCEALKRTTKQPYITVKVSYMHDKTAETAFRRVQSSLGKLGLKKAAFFVVWTIMNYDEFLKITAKGGLYDGALRAQQEGLVDHICASLHAPPDDCIKIIESGLFSGITISYSLLNQKIMQPILQRAGELDIGIATMNSLGGGLIPQNEEFFSFAKQKGDTSVSCGALKFTLAHPQITTMLSGMATLEELYENIGAVSLEEKRETAEKRIAAVERALADLHGFCTGCNYCAGCSAGIDVRMFMQSYNAVFFQGNAAFWHRADKRVLENIGICRTLKDNYQYIPPAVKNRCEKCGTCEEKCTQHIPIVKRIEELYERFNESGFSKALIKQRIAEIFTTAGQGGGYKKIGLYPGGGYTSVVLDYISEVFPSLNAELYLFDSNKNAWGTFNNNIEVRSPDTILEIKPDIIVVANYKYLEEIYASLQYVEQHGIKLVKLHREYDVPWQY